MAITDRKLFRNPRPARDTLNRMGGIMASSAPLMNQVQRFQNGGGVSANQSAINQAFAASPALAQRMAMIEAGLSPLLSRVDSQTGDIQLGGSDIEAIAEGLAGGRAARVRPGPSFSDLNTRDTGISSLVPSTPATTVGGQVVRNILGGAAEGLDKGIAFVGDIGRSVIDPFSKLNPELAAAVAAGEAELPSEIVAGINSGEVPIPKNIAEAALAGDITVSGLDLAKIEGFYDDPEEATVAEMMAAIPGQQTISVERPALPETELGRDPGPVEADAAAAAAAASTASSTGATASSAIPVPTPRPDNFAALVAASKAKTDEATAAREKEEDRMRQGQLGTIQPRTPKEIADVINKGTKEEQDSELKQLMNEFTQNAPKYEGIDKGLAIAKIGFAMAAGKSPNAIQNIASALEDGADMFIKDKAKRDEFNRQVELSAMQYGLGEVSKTRTQARADARNFRTVVANEDVIYKGRKYKKGEDILVPLTDIMANDGQLPDGFQNKDVYFKNEQAITDRLKSYNTLEAAIAKAEGTATKNLRGELVIKDEAQLKRQEAYRKAADKFIQGEIGTKYLEEAVLELSKDGQSITGLKGAGNEFMRRVASAGGFNVGDKFNDREQFRKKVKLGFQNLIKSYFGGSQSANSISNFDVTSLADAYVDAALQDDGLFALTTKSPEILVAQLQTTMQQFRRDQDAALAQMESMETMLSGRLLPGSEEVGSALSIISPEKQRVEPYKTGRALPGGTSSRFRRLDAKKGDGGRPRFNLNLG